MLVLGAQEKDEAASRSFTRLYLAFTWAFVLALLFTDFGAFLLKRRMLLGIKQRAERLSEQATSGLTRE